MSSRIADALLFVGGGLVGLLTAAGIAYFDGSTNVAWFLASMSVAALAIAPLEVFGASNWLKKTSSRGRWAVLGLGIALAGAGTAVYVVTDSVAAWWLAPLASVPIVYLFVEASEDGPRHGGGGMEGPYTPPDAGTP